MGDESEILTQYKLSCCELDSTRFEPTREFVELSSNLVYVAFHIFGLNLPAKIFCTFH